jgi:tetratricopeptide (TPR) repeat protein
MLFDLSGKRKRVVQVVYAVLAVLFAVSFVGFGIGSDAAGGIFDALGFGTNSNTNDNPAFEDQINEAEEALAADPKDEDALATLVEVHYQAANDALEVDEATGSVSFTDEAEDEYNASISAWEDYVKVARKPDGATASIANQAYGVVLPTADPAAVEGIAKDAVVPAEIVAEDTPGVGTYATLAQYAYLADDPALAEDAAKKAVAEADPSQRDSLERELEAVAKQAEQLREQVEKQAKKGGDEEAFTNPLEEGLGTGTGGLGGGTLPGTTPPPAP